MTQDNAKWILEKDKAVTAFITDKDKIDAAVASRGFSKTPGLLHKAQTVLELQLKMQLGDANMQILDEMLKQGRQQSAHDYKLAIENARIAWETEKQQLLSALEQELAVMKREMALEKETLAILAIEISARAIDLLQAKTAIELEAEAIRQDMAYLDGRTGEYEQALAEARLRTAEAKLTLIPLIQQLITAETEIIDKERTLVERETTLAEIIAQIVAKETELLAKKNELQAIMSSVQDAEQELITASTSLLAAKTSKVAYSQSLLDTREDYIDERISTLTPVLSALVSEMEAYISELTTQIELYEQIAEIKTETVSVKELQLLKKQALLVAKRSIVQATVQLAELTANLTDYQIINLAPAISDLVSLYDKYADEILDQIGIRAEIANIKTLTAQLEADKVAGELSVSAAELSLEEQNTALRAAQLARTLQRSLNDVAMLLLKATNSQEYEQTWLAAKNIDLSTQEATSSGVLDLRKLRDLLAVANSTNNTTRLEDAKILAISRETADYRDYMREDADIRTAARGITARLQHLLSQD